MSLKKAISTGLCISLLFTSGTPALAGSLNSTNTAQPPSYNYGVLDSTNLQSKLLLVEQSVYGQEQTGALLDRISRLETDFYGKTSSSKTALSDRINTLYSTMFDNSVRPSAITQMNGIEWFLSRHVSIKSITDRLTTLETQIYGKPITGTLQKRMNDLAMLAYGNSDTKTPLVATTIPVDTLVKIKLVTPLNTETSKVGDKVKFQAAEDVIYNGQLIIAAGAPGEGVVTKVKSARNFGRNGEIDVDFQQIQAFDGTYIQTTLGDKEIDEFKELNDLVGLYNVKKEIENLAMAAGASIAGIALLGPIGIVGGIFVNGKDIDLPTGTESYIQTKTATNIYAIQTNLDDNFKVNTPPITEEESYSSSTDTSSNSDVNTSPSTTTENNSSSSSTDYNTNTSSSNNDISAENNIYDYEY